MRLSVALVLVLFACGALAGDLESGLRAYNARNYAAALPPLTRAAKGGNIQAQTIVGWMYLHGEGMTSDAGQAALWFERAAAKGNVGAQYNLGLLLGAGTGVPQDLKRALLW